MWFGALCRCESVPSAATGTGTYPSLVALLLSSCDRRPVAPLLSVGRDIPFPSHHPPSASSIFFSAVKKPTSSHRARFKLTMGTTQTCFLVGKCVIWITPSSPVPFGDVPPLQGGGHGNGGTATQCIHQHHGEWGGMSETFLHVVESTGHVCGASVSFRKTFSYTERIGCPL